MADSKSSRDAKKAKTKDTKMNPGQTTSAIPAIPAISAIPERRRQAPQPEWASGLKRLYDSVVEEPLPDSFADLIAKLDNGNS